MEELVISWTDILREFPSLAKYCVHGFVYEVGYCGLPTVVIHLEPSVWLYEGFYGIEKVGCSSFELCDDLSFRGYETFIYAYAAISKFSLPSESHHCREDATSKFPVHVCIEIFTANQWTGMETVIVKAESRQCVVKFVDIVVYTRLLVVNDERYDVESGNVPYKGKMSRFINEYTQCQIFAHIQKARATAEPSLKAKNFLRVSVTPVFRPSSRGIIPNIISWRNGVRRQTRITNDPRSPASPRRAGHLQSVRRVRHRQKRLFQAVHSHPTGCRRDLSGRILRAAQTPAVCHSVRNSLEMYLRGILPSERTIPTRIIV